MFVGKGGNFDFPAFFAPINVDIALSLVRDSPDFDHRGTERRIVTVLIFLNETSNPYNNIYAIAGRSWGIDADRVLHREETLLNPSLEEFQLLESRVA